MNISEDGTGHPDAITQETKELIEAFQDIRDPDLRKTIINLLHAAADNPSVVDNIVPFR